MSIRTVLTVSPCSVGIQDRHSPEPGEIPNGVRILDQVDIPVTAHPSDVAVDPHQHPRHAAHPPLIARTIAYTTVSRMRCSAGKRQYGTRFGLRLACSSRTGPHRQPCERWCWHLARCSASGGVPCCTSATAAITLARCSVGIRPHAGLAGSPLISCKARVAAWHTCAICSTLYALASSPL